MESTILGVVLDSSVLIAAERRKHTPVQVIKNVATAVGTVPIILSALTVAEIGHGIYRANTSEIRGSRRAFLDELLGTIPIQPITAATAEIIAGLVENKRQKESISRLPISSSGPALWNWATPSRRTINATSTASQA